MPDHLNRAKFFAAIPPMPQHERQQVVWAYDLAKNWHRGQFRDDGARYFEHVRSVAKILVEHGYTSYEYLVIALLHDALEDTFLSISMLERLFGPEIVRAILVVSKTYGMEDPISGKQVKIDKKPTADYFEEIKLFGRRAAIAKCADRIHNLSDLTGEQPEGSRWTPEKRLKQVSETREWILPLAEMYEPRFAEKLRHQCELIEAGAKP